MSDRDFINKCPLMGDCNSCMWYIDSNDDKFRGCAVVIISKNIKDIKQLLKVLITINKMRNES